MPGFDGVRARGGVFLSSRPNEKCTLYVLSSIVKMHFATSVTLTDRVQQYASSHTYNHNLFNSWAHGLHFHISIPRSLPSSHSPPGKTPSSHDLADSSATISHPTKTTVYVSLSGIIHIDPPSKFELAPSPSKERTVWLGSATVDIFLSVSGRAATVVEYQYGDKAFNPSSALQPESSVDISGSTVNIQDRNGKLGRHFASFAWEADCGVCRAKYSYSTRCDLLEQTQEEIRYSLVLSVDGSKME
ncbi:uncharacterized protein STEHIDRAFT_111409 [Stereum hirsutum FP-91666 SS1]|uniref:uncharacterized protein n=1 Tax=Stereum hirsutum (strain FP-91666) TaxID=721885 RepID=UPI0004449923|nr:uncharacterized protein STEHIDRAFT_111409 [Stereum hirsutum FP-91666 SS1]EIM85779.1 hypothetical protein STEHIDRAFT_111409 [Stereum hirsutum FP-91666 SS1]